MRAYPAVITLLSFALMTPQGLRAQEQRVSLSSDSTASALPTYTLRPGDVIRLRIWREPDLSGDFPIDEYGRVNLPLIGTYPVTRETRESLHQKLVSAFGKSVENLSMDVIFIRRVPVIGAVRTPGLYPIDPTMTVGDAVALAGGSTVEANKSKILLMRSGKTVIGDVDPALLVSQLPIQRGDQLYIPPQDGFFTRNPWVIGTAIQSFVALAAAIVTVTSR
jgi:protein involved in polysaccharide export with SLBB domain